MASRRIKVLIVDDSPVVRQVLTKILSKDRRIGQVDTAPNGSLALRKMAKLNPDVVTMDVEMPGMDGLAVLKQIMKEAPRPVVMVSAVTQAGAGKTVAALELGAVDFIAKPGTGLSRDIATVGTELIDKVVAVAPLRTRWEHRRQRSQDASEKKTPRVVATQSGRDILAIGASTGGTEAIRKVLTALPAQFPLGIVIVQHMPEGFTRSFAERLDELCSITVKEAAHKDMLKPGRALLAPGHSHMMVHKEEFGTFVELAKGPAVGGHRPSVDVLFDSVADTFGQRSIAALLTGMGRDGASGMRRIHDQGGATLAQDEESCVVFGMPKAAIGEGSVDTVAPINRMGSEICRLVNADGGSARMETA